MSTYYYIIFINNYWWKKCICLDALYYLINIRCMFFVVPLVRDKVWYFHSDILFLYYIFCHLRYQNINTFLYRKYIEIQMIFREFVLNTQLSICLSDFCNRYIQFVVFCAFLSFRKQRENEPFQYIVHNFFVEIRSHLYVHNYLYCFFHSVLYFVNIFINYLCLSLFDSLYFEYLV